MKRILSALLAAAALLLSGCGGEVEIPEPTDVINIPGENSGQVVGASKAADNVFSLNYDPNSDFNPISSSSSANMQLSGLMYDTLFVVDEDFHVQSEVLASWTSAENYTWWEFKVNTDILFHDGSRLSAKDIAYSVLRAQRSSYYRSRLSNVYGVSAMGDEVLAISTYSPNSQLPCLLNIPIIKEGSLGEEVPLGTGAYVLSSDRSRLELFTSHRHASEMPLDTIYLVDCMDTAKKINAFEEATIDVVTNDPTGMYNLGYGSSNEVRYYNTTNMHYIGFNLDSRFFQSYRMRYAVGFAADREYLVHDLMGGCGVVATLPVHPHSEYYDDGYAGNFYYDVQRSSDYFGSAEVRDFDDDGALEIMMTGIVVELDIQFIVNNDSTVKVEAARRISRDLNSIGITNTLHELGYDEYIRRLECGEYDMYYGEIRLTPDWDISYLFKVPEKRYDPEKDGKFAGMNYARCFDPSYYDLYQTYLAADEGTRGEALQNAYHQVCDNGIIIPLCFERREILTHRDIITGLAPTQYDIFNRFYDWKIDLE